MMGVGNPGLSPLVGRCIGAVLLLASLVALASCNSATTSSSNDFDIDVLDKVRSLDTLPRYPQQAGGPATNAGPRGQPVVFQGTQVTDIAVAGAGGRRIAGSQRD